MLFHQDVYKRQNQDSEKYKTYILVWTTTPWTLPANMAVCVNPDFDYAYVKVDEDVYIMAEALVDSVLNEINHDHPDGQCDCDQTEKGYEILKVVKGSDIEGIEYNHPLTYEIPIQKGFNHIVIPGDHVTLTEGTGCVHTAPGHGPEDFEIGKKYGLTI